MCADLMLQMRNTLEVAIARSGKKVTALHFPLLTPNCTPREIVHNYIGVCFSPPLLLILCAGLTLADLDSVEVVGGSCRVPMVKEVITDVFKREINTTLNLDEAVARGCCLQCAILSPSFKVRSRTSTRVFFP